MVDFSLIRDPGDSIFTETVPGSNLIGEEPLLGPLQDNGGSTLTYALLPGSPAIDRGDPAFVPPPDFDQRGDGFPRVVNSRLDMGAFEVQSGAVPAGRAWLRSLGDINRDGTPEIVVVAEGDGGSRATVKDAASGKLISQFDLGADLLPVDVEVMEDFGYGSLSAPNLAVLGKGSARAETRDVLTGDLLGTVAFNASLYPLGSHRAPGSGRQRQPRAGDARPRAPAGSRSAMPSPVTRSTTSGLPRASVRIRRSRCRISTATAVPRSGWCSRRPTRPIGW